MRHHRQRLDLYRAKSYGPRPTSATRLRELERAYALASERVAQAERERRSASADQAGSNSMTE